jgi:hypothetical protein
MLVKSFYGFEITREGRLSCGINRPPTGELMNKTILILLSAISTSALAVTCPNYTLKCELKTVNRNGAMEVTRRQETAFKGYNADEPSMPATNCAAALSFSGFEAGTTLTATVSEDLNANVYLKNGYQTVDPQAVLQAVPGHSFGIYMSSKGALTCVLK